MIGQRKSLFKDLNLVGINSEKVNSTFMKETMNYYRNEAHNKSFGVVVFTNWCVDRKVPCF